MHGHGCEECKKEKIRLKRQKTTEEYIKELKNINPHIKVLEKYIDNRTAILHKCEKHNIQWRPTPLTVLRGYGCNICVAERMRERFIKTHEQYVQEVKKINNNIIVIEEYSGANIPILHKCLLDDYEWKAEPSNILSLKGCPKCAGNIRKTHDEYVFALMNVNPDIEVVGEYVNRNTPIMHRCKIDGNEWMATPSNTLYGKSCPVCKETHGERLIRQYLEKNIIKYEFQKNFDDCKDINALPFDFYLPDYNIAIEYDGRQHFEPIEYFGGQKAFEYTQKHDNIKNEYCKNNNIKLLRIPYFKNVEEELNNFLFI